MTKTPEEGIPSPITVPRATPEMIHAFAQQAGFKSLMLIGSEEKLPCKELLLEMNGHSEARCGGHNLKVMGGGIPSTFGPAFVAMALEQMVGKKLPENWLEDALGNDIDF